MGSRVEGYYLSVLRYFAEIAARGAAAQATARGNLGIGAVTDDATIRGWLAAQKPQVISDGGTTDRAIRFTPGARGALASAPVATWCGFVQVPSSNPAAVFRIFVVQGVTTDPTAATDSLRLSVGVTGSLELRANGTGTPANNRTFTWAGFLAAHAGQTVLLEVALTTGTTDPVIRANGVDISSNFTGANSGTPPAWLDPVLNSTYNLLGYGYPTNIDVALGCWINAALDAADRDYWLTHLVPSQWILDGGSMVPVAAGAFVVGKTYTITAIGTTDFTLIGAFSNTVGLRFTATGVGAGTGTAVLAGALGFPVVGPDRFVRDATRISPPIDGYMVGMRPLCTDVDGIIRGRRTSDGYLIADTQLVGDGRGIVGIWAKGDGTFSLGDSAGSPNTVLSGATATGNVVPFTPLKALTTNGKIYVDLGTATFVEVFIGTKPILDLA